MSRLRRYHWWLWPIAVLLVFWLADGIRARLAERGPVQTVTPTARQFERGRYLADAADCAACHTAPQGAPFSGGVPLATPFGTIHATNITPDPSHGIGRYTADDFFLAVTSGRRRDGRPLYPAMPYTSYRAMSRGDSDALYAYLMSQPAIPQPNTENRIDFPANIRMALHGWKMLYADRVIPAVSSGHSAPWQRGRYLVDALGHCGECHTPRGKLGQLQLDRTLAGNVGLGRFAAPEITPAALASRGWDAATLRDYLATGTSTHAMAAGEMFKVVDLSTSRLGAADIAAMSIYLLGDAPPAPSPPPAPHADEDDRRGRQLWYGLCAGCHGSDGQGVPYVVASMRDRSTLRERDPRNVVVAILDGLPARRFPGGERTQSMPGFGDELDDADVAALVSWLRHRYGGRESVPAATVAVLRNEDGR